MKNIVIGSFLGFVLAAAFLAACGSGGGTSAPVALTTPSAVKWTGLSAVQSVPVGVTLNPGQVWISTLTLDNGAVGARNQRAAIEVVTNADAASAPATLEIGIVPALDGAQFATDPVYLGSVTVDNATNRRATLIGARLPPTAFRLAVRFQPGAGTVRILGLNLATYNELLE